MRIICALLFFYSLSVLAESRIGLPPVDLRPGQVVEGNLFSVKIVPGSKETTFFVVGKEAAQIKLDKMQLQLTVDPDGTKKIFSLKRRKDAFVLDQKLESDSQLEIRSHDGKIEQLRLKAKP